MLSNHVTQQSMIQRLEQVVTLLMAERPFFQQELDYAEIVNHLAQVFQQNLSNAEFNAISENDLKERCSSSDGLKSAATRIKPLFRGYNDN